MAAELKDALSVDPVLIEGSRGIFDIRVNGRVVYSKHQTQKFPGEGEAALAVQRA